MILQACIFEIVTSQVERVPVPEWAFDALAPAGRKEEFSLCRHALSRWSPARSLGTRVIGAGCQPARNEALVLFSGGLVHRPGIEAIHFGQVELMNGNDRDLAHYSQVLALIRVLCGQARSPAHDSCATAHVPRGGFVRDGRLLMDFHSFPLRIMEVPDRPQEADLEGRIFRRPLWPEPGWCYIQRLDVRAFALSGGDRQLGRQPAARQGECRRHLGLGL